MQESEVAIQLWQQQGRQLSGFALRKEGSSTSVGRLYAS